MIEWSKLSDSDFESLCYDVLVKEGYSNLVWIGRSGGDRGRDILADRAFELANTQPIELNFKCIVQCKKYLAKAPSPSDLKDMVAWAEAHKPNLLLIMLTNTLSSDTQDWLREIAQKTAFRINVYDEKNFEQFFDTHPDVYEKHFGGQRVSSRALIIYSLLSVKSKTFKEILTDAAISESEIVSTLRDLERENIVTTVVHDGVPRYELGVSIESFLKISRGLLGLDKSFEFLTSEYAKTIVDSNLLRHIVSRFHLRIPSEIEPELVKLLRISPSALRAALFSSTAIYDTGYLHMQKLGLDSQNQDRIGRIFLSSFMLMILQNIIVDLENAKSKLTLQESKIEGYVLNIAIKMANEMSLVLSIHLELPILLLRVASAVEAGQLVAPVSPDTSVHTGNVLLQLERYEDAIEEYNRAIQAFTDRKKLAGVWNNKGVCLKRQSKHDEARQCFEKALELDPSLGEARKNMEPN